MKAFALVLVVLLAAGCTGSSPPPTREIIVTHADGTTQTLQVPADTKSGDEDGDGLDALAETTLGTDPRNADTDGDGLLDGHNRTLSEGNPLVAKWREAGILESAPGSLTFLGEEDFCPQYGGLKSTFASSDRPLPDRLSEGEEIVGWNVTIHGVEKRVTSDPCEQDTDHDGLVDDVEKALGSDPRAADSDGDGVLDGQDADPVHDLSVRFENVTARIPSGARATLTVRGAQETTSMDLALALPATIPVDDTSGSRATLNASLVLQASAEDGHALDLFGDARGTFVTLDVLAGRTQVLQGGVFATHHLAFEGKDGSLALDWVLVRG